MQVIDNKIWFNASTTEIQWAERVIESITSIDPRITCDTTASAQFDGSGITPTFNFDIAGQYQIRLQRSSDNTSVTRSYYLSMIIDGNEYNRTSVGPIRYNGLPSAILDNDSAFRCKAVIGDNFIGLWIGMGWYNPSTWYNTAFPNIWNTALVYDGSSEYYCGFTTSTNILTGSYYRCSDATAGYTFATMINFTAPAGQIYYSSIAPFTNNSTIAFLVSDILSCSTVTLGATISLPNSKNYLAIGTNAMVEIDQE